MGEGRTLILLILLIDFLHHGHHIVLLLLFFNFAVPFCPWLEFAHFFSMHILFAHLTCGTNAKWQDRRLWVCVLHFLKCKWFCVCVCECRREQFTVKIGDPPVLWLHNIWAGSARLFFIDLFVWARKHTGVVGVFLDFNSVVSFSSMIPT